MKTRKLAAILIALAIALSFGVSALAATINIDGAIEGQTYSAYIIFDVTVDSTVSPSAYAYTISSSSPWFTTVQAYAGTTDNGLTLSLSTLGHYNVLLKTGFSAEDFAEALNTHLQTTTITANATATAEKDASDNV
ncbi:MAG: hypothetical protein GX847_12790, partial [Clostridiales bacterium]|nr:hypothetical protein [Clostridiales bacterium]